MAGTAPKGAALALPDPPEPSLSLTEALAKVRKEKSLDSIRCRVGRLLLEIDGEDREALVEMLAADKRAVASAEIAAALNTSNYAMSVDSIVRHRGGKCGCARVFS